MTQEKRSAFDWVVWSMMHIVVIGGISVAGFVVYSAGLGAWVAASAIAAGFTSLYLFAKEVPGETLMKVWLGLCVAANAGYLVHNGARSIGVEAYNNAQIAKFERGMSQAARSSSRSVAKQVGLSVKDATALEKIFDDGVAAFAALLAFLELSSAIVLFAIASKRVAKAQSAEPDEWRNEPELGRAPLRRVDPSPPIRGFHGRPILTPATAQRTDAATKADDPKA
jgi:hypothetical protein